jgi:single-stranded-DNA-specific exonuclease
MKWIFPKQTNNLIDSIFTSRKISNKDIFLNPSIDQLHDPLLLHDIDKAVDAIVSASKNNKKIFIHGDFDVDGITATSIMWKFLSKELKANVLPYIPNRFTEGYGLSDESIDAITKQGGKLLISVDCGVKDIERVSKYASKIDFVITDHHNIRTYEAENEIKDSRQVGDFIISSKALAVVHPLLSAKYPFKEICGAVVSWKVCSAINETLNLGVDMTKYLDLASLGTVCDVMPLIDENRAIVKLGLKQMQKGENIGLKSLLESQKVDARLLDTYHLGFIIGPRLNAAGRLDNAMESVRLLTTDSKDLADKITQKLNGLNVQRQDLTKKFLNLAEEQIKDKDAKLHFLYGEEWPDGIIGLIAGKLTEKYNRPVLVGTLKAGRIKASARSVDGFHIANNLKKIEHLLIAHGGHELAAGFTLPYDNIDQFTEEITALCAECLSINDIEPKLMIDGVIDAKDISMNLAEEIELMAPFGMANERPIIAISKLKLKDYRTIGKENNHVKFCLVDTDHNMVQCISFNSAERLLELFNHYSTLHDASLDVAGYLSINEWNGNRTVDFKVEDVRISS